MVKGNREKARNYYLAHIPNQEICETLKISKSMLSQWIYKGGWAEERKTLDAARDSERTPAEKIADSIDLGLSEEVQLSEAARELHRDIQKKKVAGEASFYDIIQERLRSRSGQIVDTALTGMMKELESADAKTARDARKQMFDILGVNAKKQEQGTPTLDLIDSIIDEEMDLAEKIKNETLEPKIEKEPVDEFFD